MSKKFKIQLDSIDLGQLLDGLRIRAESWRNTEQYLATGRATSGPNVCEECSKTEEAMKIAEHYERLIDTIEQQIKTQGGW
jgi:hypothetical protein